MNTPDLSVVIFWTISSCIFTPSGRKDDRGLQLVQQLRPMSRRVRRIVVLHPEPLQDAVDADRLRDGQRLLAAASCDGRARNNADRARIRFPLRT